MLLPTVWFMPMSCRGVVGVWWAKAILWACRVFCGIYYEVLGKDCLPEGQFIVASVHQSPIETLVLFAELPRVVCVIKKELKTLPVIGVYFMALRMVFVDRDKKVAALRSMVRECTARIGEGRTLVMFPEGTTRLHRSTDRHLHRGVAAVYSRVSLPVVPITLDTGRYWSDGIFTLSKRKGKARIRILPAIEPGLDTAEFIDRLSVALQSQP
ncbi:lysophospholipid acyltransferase family protein [Anaplasma centrale]|uniref:lysophospholipid acyltransferase family protein n=1 Tax=Anaplasma centrale TaxID=769 RepID=UPI001EE513A8|nr:lysophospholipid acyltransferase family protein [Anaplasma centrale]